MLKKLEILDTDSADSSSVRFTFVVLYQKVQVSLIMSCLCLSLLCSREINTDILSPEGREKLNIFYHENIINYKQSEFKLKVLLFHYVIVSQGHYI